MISGSHTILGAGGTIGKPLADELRGTVDKLRLVSRKPSSEHPDDELVKADLLDAESTQKAVEGSEVVYMTVGLEFDAKVWLEQWPIMTSNLINACLKHDSRLVFFDNTFMYAQDLKVPIEEDHPVGPKSEKGKVRAEAAERIEHAIRDQRLKAAMVRSAGFYGPGSDGKSLIQETIFKPLMKGKKASVIYSDEYKHCATFIPDAVKATALIGKTPDAMGQVWHLPTSQDALTGKQWVEEIADYLQVKPRYQVLGPIMLKIAGIFVKPIRESLELMYLHNRDYVLSSNKIEKKFNLTPTSYKDGIKQTIANQN